MTERMRRFLDKYPDGGRQYMREAQQRSRERRREVFRARYREENRRRAGQRKAYDAEHAHTPKVVARVKLGKAVRLGRLQKPLACERCHAITPRRRLHGHHTDYSEPLRVTWLCTTCHGVEHRIGG